MARVAKLELSSKKDGKREKLELGGVFTGKFQGNYGVALTLPLKDKDGNTVMNDEGYPERDKIIAVKCASGRKLLIGDAFVNLIVYEALEARPPYDGPGADNPKPTDVKKEDFTDDDDF